MTRSSQVLWSIASVSFREIVRDKILYNILVIAVLLMGLGFLASKMTFVRPDRIVMDFGVSAVSLSLVAIGTFIGASQLNREVERRTMFLALSRPISSYQFVAGKFLGLLLVLFLNWVLVSAVFLGVLLLSGGLSAHSFSSTLFLALILLFCQSWVVAGFAIFFSTFSTTSLSSILVIGLFLVGNNVSQFHVIATRVQPRLMANAVEAMGIVLPNLEYFNLGTNVTYGIPVPARFAFTAIAYAVVVSAMSITLAGLLIRKKEA